MIGLSSLTGGGSLDLGSNATTGPAVSGVGPVNIGGLNVPALPGDNRLLIGGALVLGLAFIFSRRRKR